MSQVWRGDASSLAYDICTIIYTTLHSLRDPVRKFTLPTSRGQFCPTQSVRLNFHPVGDNFVPPSMEVYTSQLDGTVLSHPGGKFTLPYWV